MKSGDWRTPLWLHGFGDLSINDMETGVFLKSHCHKCAEYGSGKKQVVFPNRRLLPIGDEPTEWLYKKIDYLYPNGGADYFKYRILPILKGHGDGYLVSEEDNDLGYLYMAAHFEEADKELKDFYRSLEQSLVYIYKSKHCGYRMSFNVSDVINTLRQCDEMIEELRAEGRDESNWDLPF